MHVERFTGQYEMVSDLYDRSPAALVRYDLALEQPPQRWIAVVEGGVVAAVTGRRRPDGRIFLTFVGDASAYESLSVTAREKLKQNVYTVVKDPDLLATFQAAGFRVEVVVERFRVEFEAAIKRLRRAWLPTGFGIQSANTLDIDRLFTLDNAIRQDVPGCDGWRGDRDWFVSELAEQPPFDPSTYLVGVDAANGQYAGLIRIWRNPDGPRLGLVGVIRQYRNTSLASFLLKKALAAAAGWGHPSFLTEASPSNPIVYSRMRRVGAESTGHIWQLVY